MQIQHPTASLIARASTAQDDMTGDGTTSTVLVIGELLKQADIYVAEGLHPRVLTEGFDKARAKTLEILEKIKLPIEINRENLLDVARTSLRTKVQPNLADLLTEICVDAILSIRQTDKPVDLHMVELMEMQHKTATDTQLIKGKMYFVVELILKLAFQGSCWTMDLVIPTCRKNSQTLIF